eukprot:CAMPEP_0185264176 /NCGR_PEP_ID=MMETSP1359-20130426/20051_1 /TAXON_ID=552665 /ORGANISM="Bigelowiella longifila, Strain CCMP242" /LENGTH=73 /DNA_ID=CAMNT_0027852437 /DNA_START=213 /DNA_END=431 /DNA_ORIENTATION=+
MPVCTRQRTKLQLKKIATGKRRQSKPDTKNRDLVALRKEDVECHEPVLVSGMKNDALECTVNQDFKQQKGVRW